MSTSKKVKDNNVYKDVNFKQTIVLDLVDKGNKFFKILQGGKCITEKDLGKLYLLPKIHKRLSNVPRRPVLSNCGTSTERVSEFLDFYCRVVGPIFETLMISSTK